MTSETTEEIIIKAPDYTKFSKANCIEEAQNLLNHVDSNFASKSFNSLREHLDGIVRDERAVALKQFADDGNDVREFKGLHDEEKNTFYDLYNQFRERRKKEKEQAEAEKVKNLKDKEAILEELKLLLNETETDGSIEKVRELQHKWKQIRLVPRDQMENLWETYKVLLDRFYDNVSINRELKELDREKNLQHKIELIQKVDQLKEEKNSRRAFNYLNKYHEDFKNTGPVPKEHSEEIWKRFKATSDAIIELKNKDLEAIKEKQKENLQLKTLLCEKVEQMAEIPYESIKEWKTKSLEVDAIFEDWKKIGRVPKANNDEIWERFKKAKNTFSSNKNKFYKKLNANREDNLKLKEELCIKAEQVKDSTDFNKTADYLKSLQSKWKTIGPVPDKKSDAIWKRFRGACDEFFKLREINFKAKQELETENLEKKKVLLDKLTELTKEENDETAFKELKSIQKEWFTIGFVPFKNKKGIEGSFEKLTDQIYKKFNKSRDSRKGERLEEHYEMLSNSPNGKQKIRDEERKINDKLRKLRSESESYETNIQFFKLSKGSEGFLNEINKKIEKVGKGIIALEKELKTIRKYKQ